MQNCYYYCIENYAERAVVAKLLHLDNDNFDDTWYQMQMDSCEQLVVNTASISTDLDSLLKMANAINLLKGTKGSIYDISSINANVYRKKIVDFSETMNFIFNISYVLGSFLLGIAYLKHRKLEIVQLKNTLKVNGG